MTLKTKFLLLTCAFVLLALLVSEWLTIGATSAFLTEHEREMTVRFGDSEMSQTMQVGTQALLDHLIVLHLLIATVTVGLVVLVLHAVWKRLVETRLASLLEYMELMERGTWRAEVPDTGSDEISALARAVGRLGIQITTTAQQFGDASKLAALALLGRRLVKATTEIRELLLGTLGRLRLRQEHDRVSLQPVVDDLHSAIQRLEGVSESFQREFDHQLERHSAKPSSIRQSGPGPGGGIAQGKPEEIGTSNALRSGERTRR